MRTLVRFQVAELEPPVAEVLLAQGLPGEDVLAPRLGGLVADAFASYAELAEPCAVYEETTPSAFTALLAPLAASDELVIGRVAPRARALALYVATLGPALPDRIQQLFAQNALAEGYMLDAVASAGADLLSERLAAHFAQARPSRGGASDERTLAYSPGYCGWPTSGQRALFAALVPDEVGVTLNDSCLMTPLKSVSGVLVSAPAEAHRFCPDFPFCSACRSRECGRRMARAVVVPEGARESSAAQ
jgi:hypothetical protein